MIVLFTLEVGVWPLQVLLFVCYFVVVFVACLWTALLVGLGLRIWLFWCLARWGSCGVYVLGFLDCGIVVWCDLLIVLICWFLCFGFVYFGGFTGGLCRLFICFGFDCWLL